MRIDQLKPGQVLYSVESGRLGNTMARTVRVYRVVISEVNTKEGIFRASLNGQRAKGYWRVPNHWTAKKPVLIASGWALRKATKAERENGRLKDRGNYLQCLFDGPARGNLESRGDTE